MNECEYILSWYVPTQPPILNGMGYEARGQEAALCSWKGRSNAKQILAAKR